VARASWAPLWARRRARPVGRSLRGGPEGNCGQSVATNAGEWTALDQNGPNKSNNDPNGSPMKAQSSKLGRRLSAALVPLALLVYFPFGPSICASGKWSPFDAPD